MRWAALRSVLRRPVRTLLKVIGIGAATMAILFVEFRSSGMGQALLDGNPEALAWLTSIGLNGLSPLP